MISSESLENEKETILGRIESKIGKQLQESGRAELDLDLGEAEVVMAFLVRTLFEDHGAELMKEPEVNLAFSNEALVSFRVEVSIKAPLATRVTFCGYLCDMENGVPRLLNNKVEIVVSQKLARFALQAFGLEPLVKNALNNLPAVITRTLPPRLARLGYESGVSLVMIRICQGRVRTEVRG